MKRFLTNLSVLLCLIIICATCAFATTTLIPGGQVIGLNLADGTVTVVRVENESSPLKPGDKLLSLDSTPIRQVSDVKDNLKNEPQTLSVSRGGKTLRLQVQGEKLGVYLREGTSGLGTVTYYNPENGTFGALGHGVCKSDGTLTPMHEGQVYPAEIFSVKSGKAGAPGQLMGSLTNQAPIGTLQKNTHLGIFGKITPICAEPLPVGTKDSVQPGKATIYATVGAEGLQEYSVELLKIYPKGESSRNMLLKITDQRLLTATGGIVQGMSGSPIIQNGHLIGAVTHVLVNDPTTGYGIFIENMLDAAA